MDKRSLAPFVLLVASASPALADEPLATATMQCERAVEPGRVHCSVEARVAAGRSLSWGDVAILDLPEFAVALKGRLGPADSTSRDGTSQRWAFGIVARRAGQGEAHARVRLVVCEPPAGSDAAPPRCAPVSVDVRAAVQVGGG
jgi:hypothetical protein